MRPARKGAILLGIVLLAPTLLMLHAAPAEAPNPSRHSQVDLHAAALREALPPIQKAINRLESLTASYQEGADPHDFAEQRVVLRQELYEAAAVGEEAHKSLQAAQRSERFAALARTVRAMKSRQASDANKLAEFAGFASSRTIKHEFLRLFTRGEECLEVEEASFQQAMAERRRATHFKILGAALAVIVSLAGSAYFFLRSS